MFKNIPKHSFVLKKPTLKRETILVESNPLEFYQSLTVTSLVVQWLRLQASSAGGAGSTPGQGTKIHQLHGQKKKKIDKKHLVLVLRLLKKKTIPFKKGYLNPGRNKIFLNVIFIYIFIFIVI